MRTTVETQAQIAKEITIAFAEKIIGPTATSREAVNEAFRVEVSKFYEEIFNTVKRLTEE